MSDPLETPGNDDGMLALVGTGGWVTGECYTLKPGDDIVIGRSRSCDISLRRCQAYLDKSRQERDNDHDFNTVSRKHLRVLAVDDTFVRLEDLSTNGSYIDDVLMSDTIDINARLQQVTVRLGTREAFLVRFLSNAELAKHQHATSAAAMGTGAGPVNPQGGASSDDPLELDALDERETAGRDDDEES